MHITKPATFNTWDPPLAPCSWLPGWQCRRDSGDWSRWQWCGGSTSDSASQTASDLRASNRWIISYTRHTWTGWNVTKLQNSYIFAYTFPDVAALTDLPHISRSSAVRPTLQTLAPIQSSTSFSQYPFVRPLFPWPVWNNLLFVFNKLQESSRCDCEFIS